MKEPIVSADRAVAFVNSGAAGIFVPAAEHWSEIHKGDAIGSVIVPVTGNVEEYVTSPCDGIIFTLREFPVVYGGSLIARILGDDVNA